METQKNLYCDELLKDFEVKLKHLKKRTQSMSNHKWAFSLTRCAFCESLHAETSKERRQLSASKETPNNSNESDEFDEIGDVASFYNILYDRTNLERCLLL